MILGTAGHIDHGKTALVKALTGIDTDRLPEEQRRGITIELGFAPLRLPDTGTIGVVDVPGHEAFVRTMLAGSSGVDLALLVIAADEGVMPQTREHLAILELLGVRAGVIAVTKSDLVDADWLELVSEDVAALVAGTGFADASVVPVSAVTGAGMDALRGALAVAARELPGRDAGDLFRLPVDRSFTIKGTGTVVTGTVWTGRLSIDEVVRVLPGGRTARVRGLQSHGEAVGAIGPGMRAAVSLVGVERSDVARGCTLVTDAVWDASALLRADATLLPDVRPLGPRTRIRFHLGTQDLSGRLVAAGGALGAGAVTPVRVMLDEPVVARGGDRFVIRSGSPAATIGGGVVTDPFPGHRRLKPWPKAAASAAERVALIARDGGARGVSRAALPVRIGSRPADVDRDLADAAAETELIGGVVYDRGLIQHAIEQVVAGIEAHHKEAPLEAGMSLQSVRAAIPGGATLAAALIARLEADGTIVTDHGIVRRAGWMPRPSSAQQSELERLTAVVRAAGREPPSASELAASGVGQTESDVLTLLRLLDRRGVVRQVEPNRFYSPEALRTMADALRAGMKPGQEYGPAELRAFVGVSRKYLIPLLEYFDRMGVTERRGQGRVVRLERGAGLGNPEGVDGIPGT
jgi:selenocysteine-specific elongation factor